MAKVLLSFFLPCFPLLHLSSLSFFLLFTFFFRTSFLFFWFFRWTLGWTLSPFFLSLSLFHQVPPDLLQFSYIAPLFSNKSPKSLSRLRSLPKHLPFCLLRGVCLRRLPALLPNSGILGNSRIREFREFYSLFKITRILSLDRDMARKLVI